MKIVLNENAYMPERAHPTDAGLDLRTPYAVKIWGGDSDAEYNNVEVYISFLRKKIGALKVTTEIRTARGIGYSIEDGSRL